MKTATFDFGGTQLRGGLVDENDKVSCFASFPTNSNRRKEDIIESMAAIIESIRAMEPHADIAISTPFVFDENGAILKNTNIPSLEGVELQRELENRFPKTQIGLFNDANCFTFGEYLCGSGRDSTNFVLVALGTGIGVGLVINKRLYTGSHGLAGEIWSGAYMENNIEAHTSGESFSVYDLRLNGKKRTGEALSLLARENDEEALNVFREYGRHLGSALSWIINLMDPEMITLAGSIAKDFKFFKQTMKERILKETSAGDRTRITTSVLKEYASLIGAKHLLNAKKGEF